MSKQQTRRKITLDSSLKQVHAHSTKDAHRRPSVFERLGTKAIASNANQCPINAKPTDSFCRQWEQNGTCQFGKNCKYFIMNVRCHSGHTLPYNEPSYNEPLSFGGEKDMSQISSKTEVNTSQLGNDVTGNPQSESNNSETLIHSKNVKSCSSSSSSGSSSTGSDSTSSEETSSSASSESVESSRHHHHKLKHMNSRKQKRYSSSSDKEHSKKNNIRTGKGISPSKKSSHSALTANVGNIHKEMKHSKKRRSRDRSDGHASPRKMGLGAASGSKKSLSPPVRNMNSHKRRSQSPLLKGAKQTLHTSKLGLNSRNSGGLHGARSPPSHKEKHNRSVSPRSRERERDRNREKEEKERDRENEREKEKEKERERDKRQREKEREPVLRERDKERDKDRNRSRSPKLKLKDGISRSPRKEVKRKDSPDHHGKPGRLSGGNQKGRDDIIGSKHKVSPGDSWHRDLRKEEKEDERKRGEDRRHKEDSRKDLRLLSGHEDKDHIRDRDRDRDRERDRMHDRDRDKEKSKSMLQQGIPSLLTLNLQHNPSDFNSHLGGGVKDRAVERNRSIERTGLIRNLSMDRGRERSLDRVSERSRGSERDRRCRNNNGGLEKGLDHSGLEKELAKALARNREQDRTFERNERMPERSLDRGLDRNLERGLDRGLDRGQDRGLERGLDRTHERGLERGLDRSLKGERGIDRGSPRVLDRDSDRGLDRGLDRDPVLVRLERGSDRGLERSLERGLERGSPRMDRDHRFTERSPGDRLYSATHLDHSREPDEKGYDNNFEGRRDRGRFSDPGRFEKSAPPNDDRRLGPADAVVFNEERRRGRDGGRQVGQWNDRKRDHNHDRDHGPRGYDGSQRPPHMPSGPNSSGGKRGDWEWDGRGRRSAKEWDSAHRAETDKEWSRFPGGQGEWQGPPGERRSGGWNDEWRSPGNQSIAAGRASGRMLPAREDAPSTAHKNEEEGPSGPSTDPKADSKAEVGLESSTNHKRIRETTDGDEQSGDYKRPLLEKDSALEEVLSDISDDVDEILNREDSELGNVTQGESTSLSGKGTQPGNQSLGLPQHPNQPCLSGGIHSHHRRSAESADGVTNLGFEEISDGELEEEARARGISDALGVDWASLVAETRPRAKLEKAGSTRQRWEGVRLLTYIGVSVEYAGTKLVKYLLDAVLNPKPEAVNLGKDAAFVDASEGDSSEHCKVSPKEMCVESSQVMNKEASRSDTVKISDDSGNKCFSENDNCDKPNNVSKKEKEDSVCKIASSPEQNSITGTSTVTSARSELMPDTEVVSKSTNDKKISSTSDVVKSEGEENKAVNKLQTEGNVSKRTGDVNESRENLFCEKLLHPVAGIHTALLERKARRQALFGGSSPYTRALSARRDLAIRRQLCSLSPRETTCDNGPAVDELFRLSLQLLERAS